MAQPTAVTRFAPTLLTAMGYAKWHMPTSAKSFSANSKSNGPKTTNFGPYYANLRVVQRASRPQTRLDLRGHRSEHGWPSRTRFCLLLIRWREGA